MRNLNQSCCQLCFRKYDLWRSIPLIEKTLKLIEFERWKIRLISPVHLMLINCLPQRCYFIGQRCPLSIECHLTEWQEQCTCAPGNDQRINQVAQTIADHLSQRIITWRKARYLRQ
jgi:hypothetical protein